MSIDSYILCIFRPVRKQNATTHQVKIGLGVVVGRSVGVAVGVVVGRAVGVAVGVGRGSM